MISTEQLSTDELWTEAQAATARIRSTEVEPKDEHLYVLLCFVCFALAIIVLACGG